MRTMDRAPARWRPAAAMAWGILAGTGLMAAPAGGEQVAMPPGMTAFFVAVRECPIGWRTVPGSRGRLILAASDPAQVGMTAGQPLQGPHEPTHDHAYTVRTGPFNTHLPTRKPGKNRDGAKSKSVFKSRDGQRLVSGGAQIPLVQLPFCEPDGDQAHAGPANGPHWPDGAIAYFRGACPAPWRPYTKAGGRFIVPMTDGMRIGAQVGTPLGSLEVPPHRHKLGLTVQLERQTYSSVPRGHDGHLARTDGKLARSLVGESSNDGLDVPMMALQACLLEEGAAAPRPPLPKGFSMFYSELACPEEEGWQEVTDGKGRYLLSMPSSQDPGLAFGGPPLTEGVLPRHRHAVRDGKLDIGSEGVSGTTGAGEIGSYMAKTYLFNGASQDAEIQMPYVALRQCVFVGAR